MKTTRVLRQDSKKLACFIESLASKDAGKKARSGMSYSKRISGMNGKKQKVGVTIDELSDSRYQVTFDQDGSAYTMSYSWSPLSDGRTRLVYEEKSSMNGLMNTLNQRLGTLIFGLGAKKQIRRRLDAFETQLEAYTWQD